MAKHYTNTIMSDIEIPGYDILEPIGHGGMATVYKARHQRLNRILALKVMSPALNSDPSFSERFIREARIVAALTHPHIIQIHDVDRYQDLNFLTMEYVAGGDLTGRLKKGIDLETAINVLIQLCSALDAAHKEGYIHRDIKPGNILFRTDNSIVLTDFGIARLSESNTGMTITGSVIGTPSYMSPEQAHGGPLDNRADLYSAAVVFYEMLTGELPYKSDTALGIAMKHASAALPELSGELAKLQPFIDRSLAKQPADRFNSGQQMGLALQELVSESCDTTQILPPYRGGCPTSSGGDHPSSGRHSGRYGTPAYTPADSAEYRYNSQTVQSTDLITGSKTKAVGLIAGAFLVGGLAVGSIIYGWLQSGSTPESIPKTATESKSEHKSSTAHIAQTPTDLDNQLTNAYAALTNGNINKAVNYFQAALKNNPDSREAQQGIDQVIAELPLLIGQQLQNKKLADAKQTIDLLRTLSPQHASLFRLGYELDAKLAQQSEARKLEKLAEIRKANISAKQSPIPAKYKAPDQAQQEQQQKMAAAALAKAQQQETQQRNRKADLQQQLALADKARQAGQWKKAQAAYRQALLLSRDNPQAHASLAFVEQKLKALTDKKHKAIDNEAVALLGQFKSALQNKDKKKIAAIAELGPSQQRLITALFSAYQNIGLKTKGFEVIAASNSARAELEIVELRDKKGQIAQASDEWKKIKLVIRYDESGRVRVFWLAH